MERLRREDQVHTVKITVVVTEAAVEHRQWRGWQQLQWAQHVRLSR